MCSCLLRIKYKAQGEPPALIPFDDEAGMQSRIDELKGLDTVASVQVFRLAETIQRKEVWENVPA